MKACKIHGNARSVGIHWRPMHHQKRVQLATRSANSSMLPVIYPTVAIQEVIRGLDRDAIASQIRNSNYQMLKTLGESIKGFIDFRTICFNGLKFLFRI